MSNADQKKQDLILDALSCIDEDILARGLALRDGKPAAVTAPATEAAKAPASGERKPPVTPPLYDLSSPPPKPPRKNPWRVIAVAAAACLLFCVVPLSMWMAASLSESDKTDEAETLGNQAGINGGATSSDDFFHEPEYDWSQNAPEAEAPLETELAPDIELPEEAETPGIFETEAPVISHSPEEWDWTVISTQNGRVEKKLTVELAGYGMESLYYAYTATVDTQSEPDSFYDQPISPEDEMVLDLYARFCMSLYTMDYGSHFLLFHPDIVKLRFTGEVDQYYDYSYALGRINALMSHMRPYDTVSLNASLSENRLLEGSELAEYLADKQKALGQAGLNADRITAVRAFTAEGTVTVMNRYTAGEWGYGTEFYCYEYNGVWYMDDRHMDDDLCIDFALSTIIPGQGYLEAVTHNGVITAIEDGYVLLEDGYVFTAEDIASLIAESGVAAGDRVQIRHYDFGLPIRLTDTEEGVLYRAITLTVYDD